MSESKKIVAAAPAQIKNAASVAPAKDIVLGTNIFSGFQEFQVAQRMAQALASSTIIPTGVEQSVHCGHDQRKPQVQNGTAV
ncbi:MAG: hypothetical protein LKJ21_03110 [Oscillospiraceae bacterium]|jgi:hypothetical protein|nr:hypothetical protein [Oscillospiraceae bacterium]